mgnify:CR=1 FL=1
MFFKKLWVLEYKTIDSKGREKLAQYAGIFETLELLNDQKNRLIEILGDKITFQVYENETVYK